MISLVLVATSCNYLDIVPDNVATIDHAFSDRYTAERYLATCYWHMPRSADKNANPAYMGSGEFMSNKERLTTSLKIARGNQNSSDPLINMWSGGNGGNNLWQGINDCNIFLENIGKVKDLTNTEINKWSAEVKFLKAYYHFYLLRYYGPIHIMDKNMDVSESTEIVRADRLPIDDCFEYIVSLLDEIITSEALPTVIDKPKQELGKITQQIAMAVRAKVLVTWASPLFNGNTDFADFKNAQGVNFFNQTKNDKLWARAAEACDIAIKQCTALGYTLFLPTDLKTNKQLSPDSRIQLAYRSAISERWNNEVIWGNSNSIIDETQQRDIVPHLHQVSEHVVSGWYAPTMNVAEMYYSENGVPIDEDPQFDYPNRYKYRVCNQGDKYYNIEEGETSARLNFGRENRFYASLGFDRGKWYSFVGTNEAVAKDVDAPFLSARFNEYSSMYNPFDYSATGYFAKKLVSVNAGFISQHSFKGESYPYPEMRLADLYLLYAEALNETKSAPDNDVYKWIDKVRARSGLEGVVTSWSNHSTKPNRPTTQIGMRGIIQHERNIELAFEGSNYWDVRRWKTAMTICNRAVKGWNVLFQAEDEYYIVRTLFNQKFMPRDYLAPLSEEEIVNNPNLIQNPGW